jgi:hypothetical protein
MKTLAHLVGASVCACTEARNCEERAGLRSDPPIRGHIGCVSDGLARCSPAAVGLPPRCGFCRYQAAPRPQNGCCCGLRGFDGSRGFTRALSLFKLIFEPICTDGDMESCTNKENAMGLWIFPILPRSCGTLYTYQLTFSGVRLSGKPGARSSERLWIMN